MQPITDVARAVALLRDGGLVALPTETVYGLAADAQNVTAVARIFTIKGRPTGHPLIVHIADSTHLDMWARDIPTYARLLATAYWPGPLTVILPKQAHVLDAVTGGQPTVGLRVPAHPVALAVLRDVDGLAAPSANRFGRVSPTTAQHVVDDIGDLLDPTTDAILDGGPCTVGLESTIVDCTGPLPRLLRAGAITPAMIEETTGLDLLAADGTIRASGNLASHYAPHAEVVITSAHGLSREVAQARGPVGVIAPAAVAIPTTAVALLRAVDAHAYAQGLYGALRAADAHACATVCVVMPEDEGLGLAIRDRLARAAHSRD